MVFWWPTSWNVIAYQRPNGVFAYTFMTIILDFSDWIPFLPLVCSVRFSTDSLSSSRVWKSRSTADNTKRVNALGGTWFRFSLRNFVDDCQKRRVHSKFIPNLWDNAGRERSTGKFLGICLIYDCTWCAESTVIIFCIFAFLQILDFCLTLLGR